MYIVIRTWNNPKYRSSLASNSEIGSIIQKAKVELWGESDPDKVGRNSAHRKIERTMNTENPVNSYKNQYSRTTYIKSKCYKLIYFPRRL